jgi:hypothetical protein
MGKSGATWRKARCTCVRPFSNTWWRPPISRPKPFRSTPTISGCWGEETIRDLNQNPSLSWRSFLLAFSYYIVRDGFHVAHTRHMNAVHGFGWGWRAWLTRIGSVRSWWPCADAGSPFEFFLCAACAGSHRALVVLGAHPDFASLLLRHSLATLFIMAVGLTRAPGAVRLLRAFDICDGMLDADCLRAPWFNGKPGPPGTLELPRSSTFGSTVAWPAQGIIPARIMGIQVNLPTPSRCGRHEGAIRIVHPDGTPPPRSSHKIPRIAPTFRLEARACKSASSALHVTLTTPCLLRLTGSCLYQ